MKYSAVAIGTFDGFHLGHRYLISQLIDTAAKMGYRPVIVALSKPVKPVLGVLSTEQEKIGLLRQYPLDEIVIIPSSKELISLSADEFFSGFLRKALGMRHLVVGSDFAFGRGRQGDTEWLKRECSGSRTGMTVVAPLRRSGRVVSSSLIRELLKKGCLNEANSLLGRFYHFEGLQEKGRGLGSKIGFPTVNIAVPEDKILPAGVHAALIEAEGRIWPGVINIGIRPTFFSEGKTVPEMHIFGFSGKWPKVKTGIYLCAKLRKEKKFKDIKSLKQQIFKDIAASEKYFKLS